MIAGPGPMAWKTVLTPDPIPFAPAKNLAVTGDALGYYDTRTHELATMAWRHGDIEDAAVLTRQYSIVARLTLAPAVTAHVMYGYTDAPTLAAAQSQVAAAAAAAQGRDDSPANGPPTPKR